MTIISYISNFFLCYSSEGQLNIPSDFVINSQKTSLYVFQNINNCVFVLFVEPYVRMYTHDETQIAMGLICNPQTTSWYTNK